MTEAMLLTLVIRMMIDNEDEIRSLLAEIAFEDLGHIRSALKDATGRVEREMMSRA